MLQLIKKKIFARLFRVISILSFPRTNACGAQTRLRFKAAVPEPATLSQSLAAGHSRAAHREMRPKFPLCGEGSMVSSSAGLCCWCCITSRREWGTKREDRETLLLWSGRRWKQWGKKKKMQRTNDNCQKRSIWSSATATGFLATASCCLEVAPSGQQGVGTYRWPQTTSSSFLLKPDPPCAVNAGSQKRERERGYVKVYKHAHRGPSRLAMQTLHTHTQQCEIIWLRCRWNSFINHKHRGIKLRFTLLWFCCVALANISVHKPTVAN